MRWLSLVVLASLAFYGWTLVASGGAPASGVLLVFITAGLGLSAVMGR